MRFDRNAVCRDSRRKTAIRLQKKRNQPEPIEEIEDVQPFRRVQFAKFTDTRKRSSQRRFHMAVIAEGHPTGTLSHISTLDGSPYRRPSLISVSFYTGSFVTHRSPIPLVRRAVSSAFNESASNHMRRHPNIRASFSITSAPISLVFRIASHKGLMQCLDPLTFVFEYAPKGREIRKPPLRNLLLHVANR